MTRSRLLAVLATFALAVAGCGGGDGGGGAGGGGDARAVLKTAFDKQVDSADLKIDVKANLDGVPGLKGPLSLSLAGPYKSNGDKAIPSLDWKINAQGAGQNISAGLIVTKDNAFVEFQGQSYEVGSELFQRLAKGLAKRPSGGKQTTLKQLGIDPSQWLKDPKLEDGQDIGGDSTRKVTGDVDVKKVVKDVLEALRSPAVRSQLQSQGQTVPQIPAVKDSDIQKVEDAIDELKFEVNVDKNEIARRFFAEARFKVPQSTNANGLKGGKISFGLVLEKVGINPNIKAPSNAQPLSQLLQGFGLGGGTGLPKQ